MAEYSLTIEIVAHTKRREMAGSLKEAVDADAVWFDNGFFGEWGNHMRAWGHAAATKSTHALVLQDDAVPIENFREIVLEAVSQKPEDVISLYVGTHRPRRVEVLRAAKKAEEKEASWMWADTLMWGVGLLMPTSLVPVMMTECKKVKKLPYDQRIGRWCELTGRPVYYTWPSLVDHADTETVAHKGQPQHGARVAHKIGAPKWNDVVVQIDKPRQNRVGSNKDKG